MKLVSFLLLVSMFFHPTPSGSQPIPGLPKKIASALDSKYPGWHLVDNARIIPRLQVNGVDTTKCRPNFVWGDFDGNSKRDYVVFIERRIESTPREQFLVAFLACGLDFNDYLLEKAEGDANITEFIWLAEKGSDVYDFERDEKFVLMHDSIELIVYGKASNLVYYEKGEFKRITTGD
jgi:hypothetical protein